MTIYLNGQFMPIEEAKISVLDRGFIFGDGVYEVIPVYSRKAFRLEEHLRRLQHSLDGIKLANPHSNTEWTRIIDELIARNAGEDQYLYLHITRGVARRDHAFPKPPVAPTVFMMSSPLPSPPVDLLHSGIACITAPDNRWLRCDIKAIALLPNVMLPGITYDVVLELAAANSIPYEVRRIAAAEVFAADELLLTSSTKEVLAITQLDGKPVGSGKPGAMFARLHALYQDFKRDVMRA